MLKAQLKDDLFFGYSLPVSMAAPWLAGTPLKSWVWKGRAWCLVVAVRLSKRRFFGLPILDDQRVIALMHLVEYRDRQGALRKGNYFLLGSTDANFVPLLTMLTSWDLQGRPLQISHGQVNTQGFRAKVVAGKRRSAAMEAVLDGDHSGILRVGRGTYYSSLEKSHWDMRPLAVSGERCEWLESKGAKFEFAFDSSNSQAHWALWRKVKPL